MRRNNIGFCLPQQNADNAASAIAETAEIQKKTWWSAEANFHKISWSLWVCLRPKLEDTLW